MNQIITHISIQSTSTRLSLISISDGDTELARITTPPVLKRENDEPDPPRAGVELRPDYPLVVKNLQVACAGDDFGDWHLDGAGVLNIRIV